MIFKPLGNLILVSLDPTRNGSLNLEELVLLIMEIVIARLGKERKSK